MKHVVYLAGPITGLSYQGCTDWRKFAKEQLDCDTIQAVSPMRAKEYLQRVPVISGHGREYESMGVYSTPRAVMTRDRFDATRCSVLLANLLLPVVNDWPYSK